jgi:DNA invertase Pin-like site-specific DNA recombinase
MPDIPASDHNLKGWTIVQEFVETDSAFMDGLERPQLKEMLEFARAKQVDRLMFFKADRFTRDTGDGVILRRIIQRLGVQLYFLMPYPQEVRSDGQLELLSIVQDCDSQQYVENLREASMRGLRGKIESGAYHQGHCPSLAGANALKDS